MVEEIVEALIVGGVGKAAAKAVGDAYAGLKGLIVGKFGARSEAAEALARLEAKPDSAGRRASLDEELKAAGAGEDAELVEAARRLRAALDGLPAELRSHVQNAVGTNIGQADRGSIVEIKVGR